MNKILLTIYIILQFFIAGCENDWIEIIMTPNGLNPVFHFKYVKKQDKPVCLWEIDIVESGKDNFIWTNHYIWGLISIEPSIAFEDEERLIPRDVREINNTLKSLKRKGPLCINLEELIFGIVPYGFYQYMPKNINRPELKSDGRYLIIVGGGNASGMMEFTIEHECRQFCFHPVCKGIHSFNEEDKCKK